MMTTSEPSRADSCTADSGIAVLHHTAQGQIRARTLGKRLVSLSANDAVISPQRQGLNSLGQAKGALNKETLNIDIDASGIDASGINASGINASGAGATAKDQGVVVAVIDTGIDSTHPDLVNNLWTNPGEIPNNNIDDDGNGYVDDYHGYDFVNDDGDPTDDNGHGTHIAGIIAADNDNAFGTVGIAPDAQIMVLKFLDQNSEGSTFDAIQAIEYATLMGADIINASWGGEVYSQALNDAIAAAANVGQLVVTAAGNAGTNNDVAPQYPASYDLDNVISVGASTASDQLASFSNYGQTSVDLVAPGDNIYSTLPNGQYGTLSGTSMAAPYVTGTAALLRAAYPNLSPNDLKAVILGSTDVLPELADVVASGGQLNVSQALADGASWASASATDGLADDLAGVEELAVDFVGKADELTGLTGLTGLIDSAVEEANAALLASVLDHGDLPLALTAPPVAESIGPLSDLPDAIAIGSSPKRSDSSSWGNVDVLTAQLDRELYPVSHDPLRPSHYP